MEEYETNLEEEEETKPQQQIETDYLCRDLPHVNTQGILYHDQNCLSQIVVRGQENLFPNLFHNLSTVIGTFRIRTII